MGFLYNALKQQLYNHLNKKEHTKSRDISEELALSSSGNNKCQRIKNQFFFNYEQSQDLINSRKVSGTVCMK